MVLKLLGWQGTRGHPPEELSPPDSREPPARPVWQMVAHRNNVTNVRPEWEYLYGRGAEGRTPFPLFPSLEDEWGEDE